MDEDEELMSKQKNSLDYERYLFKRCALTPDLKALNVDTVRKERRRKFQTVGKERWPNSSRYGGGQQKQTKER